MKFHFGKDFLLVAFLLLLMGCQKTPNEFPVQSLVTLPPPNVLLPGHWVVAQVAGDECRYHVVRAHVDLTPEDLKAAKGLALSCSKVDEVAIAGSTMLLHGPCPSVDSDGEACWMATSWPEGQEWKQTPLQSPILLFEQQVLFPCGPLQWCQWQPGGNGPAHAFPPIQVSPQTDADALMPLAWRPPWLLMGEEAHCDSGMGGKVWPVFQKYWFINLTTGLPSPWKVWQAIDATPRCLHEGETLEGYVWIDLIGWNPARAGELAFAVRRFPKGFYERPLDMYPFRTEIYVWYADGKFVKVGAFSHLSCGLWAPDGSGWLCKRLDNEGNVKSDVFIARQGKIVAEWPQMVGLEILQWVP